MSTQYEKLSFERKSLQKRNEAPEWLSTAGYQLLKGNNYLLTAETPNGMYRRVAKRISLVLSSTTIWASPAPRVPLSTENLASTSE